MDQQPVSGMQYLAARHGRRWTQEHLAALAQVSRGTIAALETDERAVLENNRKAVIDAFRREGVTFEQDEDRMAVIFHRERIADPTEAEAA